MDKIKILIAAHKNCVLPKDDVFLPIQVGKKIAKDKLEIQGDDDGVNISDKNRSFCELTALYWAWKNCKSDIIGLCHYRRYFNFSKSNNLFRRNIYPLSENSLNNVIPPKNRIKNILRRHDIILTKPNTYPYSLDIDYKIGQIREDLLITYDVINEFTPEYNHAVIRYMKENNKLYHYNMFICKSEIFNAYCEWLFKILFETEKRIKLSPYPYQQRVMGFLSERLLGVYCVHNNLKIKTLPISFIGTTSSKKYTSLFRFKFKNMRSNLSFIISNPRTILKN